MADKLRATCEKCKTDMYHGPVGDVWLPRWAGRIEKYLCIHCSETVCFTREGTLAERGSAECVPDDWHDPPAGE